MVIATIRRGSLFQSELMETIERYLTCAMSFTIDGEPVRFRLLTSRDKHLWMEFVNNCSDESLWHRFLSPFSATPERAKRFCNHNPGEEVAVVAEMKTADQHKFLGIARLIKNKLCEGEAEYAIIISDAWQNKSLGITLSEQCIELARREGYKTLRAETLQENYAMIRIFRRCHFNFDGKDENMVSMTLNLW
jgi:RimJ/RimL family protein N-acetyltransferase